MTKKRHLNLSFLFFLLLGSLSAQNGEVIPFSDDRWTFDGNPHELVDYLGRPSLHFNGQTGFARLDDANFLNGTIEFDVALPDKRTFLGLMFRLQDTGNYEEFYFRPHQSGNPDAYQYSPVHNGLNGWQLYVGPGFSSPVAYHFDDWTHVKIVVNGSRAEVFLNGVTQPAFDLPFLLREPAAGGVGVWGRDGYFTNFRYTRESSPVLQSPVQPLPEVETGAVTDWMVSNPFSESIIADQTILIEGESEGLEWTALRTGPFGYANLAKVARRTQENNTVFASFIVDTDQAVIKEMQLAFSDRARVFLNGRALYFGHDEFRSRDYRFLGTMGYYDSVFLPLQRGRNEIWIAVSENFGGWATKARFPDESGIRWKAE